MLNMFCTTFIIIVINKYESNKESFAINYFFHFTDHTVDPIRTEGGSLGRSSRFFDITAIRLKNVENIFCIFEFIFEFD